MAVEITGEYLGNKKMRLWHGPSGVEIRTAAPLDNNGDGSSFSPTDLVAGALGACMMTVMAIVAERDGIDLAGMAMRIEKHMTGTPRRIARLSVTLIMPDHLTPEERQKLERASHACPVHRSLLPDISIETQFVYRPAPTVPSVNRGNEK